MKLLLILFFLPLLICCDSIQEESSAGIKTGAQILIENHISELEGKRVGLVMNPTARVKEIHVLDTLLALDVNITALFAPEHGFRGDYADGEVIEGGIDRDSGLPVFSLYGANKKPSEVMLKEVDILLFDMQDVGVRFYTYNSTMKNIIEAAVEFDKEVWILDRPNPAGGEYVSGWVLEDEYESFVGSYPIPVAHGLTLGELALMAIGEGWLNTEKKPTVKVIKMEGWERSMLWPETGLKWIPPSPNLPTFEHAYVYLGTCFFEGVNISEGRGTNSPFLTIGYPGIELNLSEIGKLGKKYRVEIDTTSFIPQTIPGKAFNPKYEGERIKGVSIQITQDFNDPVSFGLELVKLFRSTIINQDKEFTYRRHLLLLSGSDEILNWEEKYDWVIEIEDFKSKREKYLLYN